MRRLGFSIIQGHLALDWYGLYSTAALCEACWYYLQTRLWIISVCSVSLGEIVFLCDGWQNGRNWLAIGWMTWTDWTDLMIQVLDGGTIVIRCRIGSKIIGSRGAVGVRKRQLPPISSVLQGGQSICISAAKNHNTLHTNPSCNILQCSAKSTNDTIVL